MFASRPSVSAFYAALWAECEGGSPPPTLAPDAPLPPFLCRALAFGDERFPAHAPRNAAMAGTPDAEVRRIEADGVALHWAVSGVSPLLLELLPLAGHRFARPEAERAARLERALAELAALGGEFAASLGAWTGTLVWLEQWDEAAEPFNSSSFPALPHCTLITDRAAWQLPPSTVLPAPRALALAENLYHESIHQQLSATLLLEEMLRPEYDARRAPRIEVPWRRRGWEVDRVLHATAVYARLLPMRRAVLERHDLDPVERDAWSEASRQGAECVAWLADRLDESRGWFTAAGEALVEQVCADARATLARLS